MKTIKFIFVFALAILTFNCSKSDDSSETQPPLGDLETLIIGIWKTESRTLNGEDIVLDCSNGLSRTLTFTGTTISFGNDYDDEFDCESLPFSGTYSIDGNTVLFGNPWNEDIDTMTVLSINATTLQTIYTSEDDDVTINTYRKM